MWSLIIAAVKQESFSIWRLLSVWWPVISTGPGLDVCMWACVYVFMCVCVCVIKCFCVCFFCSACPEGIPRYMKQGIYFSRIPHNIFLSPTCPRLIPGLLDRPCSTSRGRPKHSLFLLSIVSVLLSVLLMNPSWRIWDELSDIERRWQCLRITVLKRSVFHSIPPMAVFCFVQLNLD